VKLPSPAKGIRMQCGTLGEAQRGARTFTAATLPVRMHMNMPSIAACVRHERRPYRVVTLQ